jgi:hypothetical protein
MFTKSKYLRYYTVAIGLVFIYSSFGYLVLFNPLKILIKEFVQKSLIENTIENEDLNTFVFHINDLTNNVYDLIWVGSDEFRFNDKIYDIKEKVTKGDSLYLTGYYDHQENILESIFTLLLVNNKKDINQHSTNNVFLFGFFYEEVKDFSSKFFKKNTTNIPLLKTENGIQSFIKDIPSPPPRFVV